LSGESVSMGVLGHVTSYILRCYDYFWQHRMPTQAWAWHQRMVDMTQVSEKCETGHFSAVTEKIGSLVQQQRWDELEVIINEFGESEQPEGYKLLTRGVSHYIRGEYGETVELIDRAQELLLEHEYPEENGIYSAIWVNAQLLLPQRERKAHNRGYRFYKKNITALREVDEKLAQEVQQSVWPSDYVLVELWPGLHLYAPSNKTLLNIGEDIKIQLDGHLKGRNPMAFGGTGTGQEIRYCLDHQVDILHGMTRTHYLFEERPEMIRVLLHLRDFSRELLSEELLIFGGSGFKDSIAQRFGTLRYAAPGLIIGEAAKVQGYITEIIAPEFNTDCQSSVQRYYASDEFRDRQRQIATGEIMPRVQVDTCRWTTFLKYCAADFDKAFRQLGCETRYLIEENDVQTLTPAYRWRELDEFKPDVVFMVSHARPSCGYFPRELPFMGYIQDKCGPILTLADLAEHITGQDLFICVVREFQDYLASKNVPRGQTCVLPVPADETVFYPLPMDDARAQELEIDVSYVKHGNADTEAILKEWMGLAGLRGTQNEFLCHLAKFFNDLYGQFLQRPGHRWYEDELQELIKQRFGALVRQDTWPKIQQLITTFYFQVYAACRRRYYLEALAKNDISLRLYGNGWSEDPQFSRYAAGPLTRGKRLNAVYNFSNINLHLHPCTTMHPRLTECALAESFIMVADHPDKDCESARSYFEPDKEVVFFDTAEELVDRCRYYLAHPEERREIAGNMRERALRERTCVAGAKFVLEKWRKLLLSNH